LLPAQVKFEQGILTGQNDHDISESKMYDQLQAEALAKAPGLD
jgi:hypothetical protein